MNIHYNTKSFPGLIELMVYHLHDLNKVFLVEIIEIGNRQHAKLESRILFLDVRIMTQSFDMVAFETIPSSPLLPRPSRLPPRSLPPPSTSPSPSPSRPLLAPPRSPSLPPPSHPRTKGERCSPFTYKVQTNLGNYLQDCVRLNLKLTSVLPSWGLVSSLLSSLSLLSSVLPSLSLLSSLLQANTDLDMRTWFLYWISMTWNNMKPLLNIMVSITLFRKCIFFPSLLIIICL